MKFVGSACPPRVIFSASALTLGLVLGLSVLLGELRAAPSDFEVRAPWVRAPAPGVSATAGYFVLVNRSAEDDVLIGASSPRAANVQVHATITSGGVARMRPMSRIAVPAGQTVSFAPGGAHLMFMGLLAPLATGESVPVTLIFESAGELTVRFVVRSGP